MQYYNVHIVVGLKLYVCLHLQFFSANRGLFVVFVCHVVFRVLCVMNSINAMCRVSYVMCGIRLRRAY